MKLIDKMYKYEMDLAIIIEDIERTRFSPQTDGRTDKMKPVYPLHIVELASFEQTLICTFIDTKER